MVIIDGFTIDASLEETHTHDSEVTEYPIEDGSTIADNVRPNPIEFEVTGLVSDTPIGSIADLRTRDTTSTTGALGYLPSERTLSKLRAIRAAREPVTVETEILTYDDMILEKLEVPRDRETGFALKFKAKFKQIIVAVNKRTLVRVATRVAVPSAAKKKDLGNKGPGSGTYKTVFVDGKGNKATRIHRNELAGEWQDEDGEPVFEKHGTPGHPVEALDRYDYDPQSGTWATKDAPSVTKGGFGSLRPDAQPQHGWWDEVPVFE